MSAALPPFKARLFAVGLGLLLITLFSSAAFSQRADHLTNEEIELIRDEQAVDDRMDIYTRAIERRLIVIEGTGSLSKDDLKRLEKESEKWGELPEGTPSELYSDIYRILDEAVSKIEDVADRNAESKLFPFAVHILADYSRALVPRLEALKAKASSARDIALLNDSIGQCSDIIEASSKVDKPDPKDRKKAKKEAAKLSS
ncbi:MAG: hypothetical protein IPM63_01825 [Acidobacteriota bacterium]|nr:MAG: hypothetical protein IPM63_01825 [Acidobacteriota bacterium]